MAKNRYNTAPVDYTPKSERQPKEEPTIPSTPCIICQKMTQGYGRWADGNTCSKDCESVKESLPKLHGGQSCEK
jgi:hypothetical protein